MGGIARSLRRLLGAVAALGGFSLAASSCVSVLGIEPLERDPCAAPPYADEACVACVRDECCAPSAGRAADADCAEADRCMAGCLPNDPTCRYGCFQHNQAAMASELFAAVDDCRRSSCFDDCVGLGGWDGFYPADADCSTCHATCAPDSAQCAASRDCDTVTSCVAACKDPACSYRCFDVLPYREYREQVGPLEECVRGCTGACGAAGDFSCVDNYTWLSGGPEPSIGELFLVDASTNEGLAGIATWMCEEVDCATCLEQSHPDAITTDEDGRLLMPVAHGFRGCIAMKGGAITPVLAYLAWPITTSLPARPSRLVPNLPLETLATIFGVEHLPGRGVLFVEQHDCALSKASVVELESSNVDEQTAPTAYNDGELTFTVGARGDEAIIFSHPVGATTVTGHADGVAISSGTVYVVPDAITYVVLMPRSIE